MSRSRYAACCLLSTQHPAPLMAPCHDRFILHPSALILQSLLLVDGFHRLEAMRRLGRTQMDVLVSEGTRDDAIMLACELKAHSQHSCPRAQ